MLATDGEPRSCPANTAQDVANLAAAALAGPHHIETFVIGVGQALANLNQVAKAGGTRQAFLTDTQNDLQSDFSAALDAIRTRASPCAFTIPSESENGPVDPGLVNVRVTPPNATESVVVAKTFGGVGSECGPAGGWYYDDPSDPSLIQLCDATCQAITNMHVEVEFGCETIVQLPR